MPARQLDRGDVWRLMHICGAVGTIVTFWLHFAGVPSWAQGSGASAAFVQDQQYQVAPAPEPGSHPLYWIRRINEPTAVMERATWLWRTPSAE